jgi:O-antigen/teichoic acid export membrane protein
MTYSVLLMTLVFLVLSFFLEDIVRAPLFWGKPLIAEPYWSGLNIVPVILLAYLFLGVYNNLVAGIYIEKKTQHLPLVTFVGAGVSIGATYLLVPVIGLMGAAVATLLSYVTMAGLLFVIVQRVYPVPYEYGRLARIAVAGTVVYALYQIVDTGPIRLVWGGFLLLGFVGMMALMRFFLPSELAGVQKLLRRPPSTPA